MHTVKTSSEFAALSELEVNAALDAYDDSVEEEHSSCGGGEENEAQPANPIVAEVSRLIRAYTERMNELIEEAKSGRGEITETFLAEVLAYEPNVPIERIAFDFVADAILDEEDGD